MLPITALYAAIFTFFFIKLAFDVIKLRRANRIALGAGGIDALEAAIRAHGNFAEYVPLGLILLALLEANGGLAIVVALLGAALLAGRYFHAQGLQTSNLKKRVRGMQLTFGSLGILAVLNLAYAVASGLS